MWEEKLVSANLPLDLRASTSQHAFRVRFCETDLMGIVHHANYLAYFEMGRVDWLRKRGVTYADWAQRGMHLPVVEVALRYKVPAKFDDVLELETRLGELRSHSLRYHYRLSRSGVLLTEGETRLACINESGKLKAFSPEMLAVLQAPESAAEQISPENSKIA
jgi:acyl-CoA thioester hydrolase